MRRNVRYSKQPLTQGQLEFMRKNRGVVHPPTHRTPAAELPPLTPEERLQERLEARRQAKAWEEERAARARRG